VDDPAALGMTRVEVVMAAQLKPRAKQDQVPPKQKAAWVWHPAAPLRMTRLSSGYV